MTDEQTPSPMEAPIIPKRGLIARLRTYFLTGVIVVAPISITIYLAWGFINFVDNHVTPLIPAKYNPETYLPVSLPGLGVLVVMVGLTLIGFLTANLLGRTLVNFGERIVGRMPVIRNIYNALKQIIETVFTQSDTSFREVVLVEYPRKGLWAIAFVTGKAQGEIRRDFDGEMVNVFLPTTPNPTSGFLLFVPKKDVIRLKMTVEEGVKLVISAGMVWPEDTAKKLAAKKGEELPEGTAGTNSQP